MPTPPVVKIGVWESKQFVGAVLFSRGSNNNLGKPYGLKLTEICELTRIALSVHKTPVSRIISIAVRLLKKRSPGLRLIVSFADPNEGHHGGIYQASGWIFSGNAPSSQKYLTASGEVLRDRQVSPSGYKRQYGTLRRVPKPVDLIHIPQADKYRYLFPLDTEMRKLVSALAKPYPKRGVGETDSAPDPNRETGDARSTTPLSNRLKKNQ